MSGPEAIYQNIRAKQYKPDLAKLRFAVLSSSCIQPGYAKSEFKLADLKSERPTPLRTCKEKMYLQFDDGQ